MELAAANTERNSGRPTLAPDGRSMTFGGRTFYRCADGTFRETHTARSDGGAIGNQAQRLRLELEIEAGQ